MDREKEEEMTERKHGMKVGKRNEKILYIYKQSNSTKF